MPICKQCGQEFIRERDTKSFCRATCRSLYRYHKNRKVKDGKVSVQDKIITVQQNPVSVQEDVITLTVVTGTPDLVINENGIHPLEEEIEELNYDDSESNTR